MFLSLSVFHVADDEVGPAGRELSGSAPESIPALQSAASPFAAGSTHNKLVGKTVVSLNQRNQLAGCCVGQSWPLEGMSSELSSGNTGHL